MGQKWAKKMVKIQQIYCHHFSVSKLPIKMLLAIFTQILVPEIQISGHFWVKSSFLGPNSSCTEMFTAKPMVVGCVKHYSIHVSKILGRSFEPFFHKVQKTAKKGQKGQKRVFLAKSASLVPLCC